MACTQKFITHSYTQSQESIHVRTHYIHMLRHRVAYICNNNYYMTLYKYVLYIPVTMHTYLIMQHAYINVTVYLCSATKMYMQFHTFFAARTAPFECSINIFHRGVHISSVVFPHLQLKREVTCKRDDNVIFLN